MNFKNNIDIATLNLRLKMWQQQWFLERKRVWLNVVFFFYFSYDRKKKGNPVSSYIISKQFFFLFVLSVHVVCRKRMDGRWGECKWATEEGRASGQKKYSGSFLIFFTVWDHEDSISSPIVHCPNNSTI